MKGWPELKAAVDESAAALGRNTVVASCQYALCAHILTALDDRPRVYCPSFRRTEFDFIGRRDPPQGVPVLYITDDHYHEDPAQLLPGPKLPAATRGQHPARRAVAPELQAVGVPAPGRVVNEHATPSAYESPPGPASATVLSPFERGLKRLLEWQIQRPLAVLFVIALLTAVSLGLASRLKLSPTSTCCCRVPGPACRNCTGCRARTSSLSTIFVVLEGQDPAGLRRASDALVPALSELGPPWVGHIETGVQEAVGFLKPRTGSLCGPQDSQAASGRGGSPLRVRSRQAQRAVHGLGRQPAAAD